MHMELHEVPKETYIRVVSKDRIVSPPGALLIHKGELIFFDHLDEAYSYCHKVDDKTLEIGEVCHVSAFENVEIVELDELYTFEQIPETVGRSGYGKDGKGKYRQSHLSKMSDSWVKASIDFVDKDHLHRKYYIKELKYRKENNIIITE